jgi:hypothetical protein
MKIVSIEHALSELIANLMVWKSIDKLITKLIE